MTRLVIGLFLIVVPVLELVLLIKLGQWIGVWATLAVVVTMAFTGILIISQQSFTVLRRTLEALSEGRPPMAEVLDGLFLMVAGALFLMPGLLTDALALILLVPPARHAVARWSMGQMLDVQRNLEPDGPTAHQEYEEQRRTQPSSNGPVIDGEFERLGETPAAPRRGNGASAA